MSNYEFLLPPADFNHFKEVSAEDSEGYLKWCDDLGGEFDKLSKKETEEFFRWFMEIKDYRLELLREYVYETGGKVTFDFSAESLIPLWEWYAGHLYRVKRSKEGIEAARRRFPSWMEPHIATEIISMESLKICIDISIYFGDTLIKSNEDTLRWGYFLKPKNKAFLHRPVILGFSRNRSLYPAHVTYMMALRELEEFNRERLYDLYRIWEGSVEQ